MAKCLYLLLPSTHEVAGTTMWESLLIRIHSHAAYSPRGLGGVTLCSFRGCLRASSNGIQQLFHYNWLPIHTLPQSLGDLTSAPSKDTRCQICVHPIRIMFQALCSVEEMEGGSPSTPSVDARRLELHLMGCLPV